MSGPLRWLRTEASASLARVSDQTQVSLMFSGGVDSTTAALALSRRFETVHLLTYGNGYGHYKLGRTRKRVRELRRFVDARLVHNLSSSKELFELLLVDDVKAEFQRYGSGFVWCLGCKLAMHTASVLYNLEHGIGVMADGSSRSTGEMVEQSLLSLYLFREFYGSFGIEFTTPVYDIPREEEIRRLEQQGFRMGLRVLDRFLGVQPKCRAGELYYLPFLLFDQPPAHDDDQVAEFIERKAEVARRWIEQQCAARGIPAHIGEAA